MVIPALIVTHHPFLDAFLGDLQCDMDDPVRTPLCRQNSKFNGSKRRTRIPVCHIRQKFQCVIIHFRVVRPHAFFSVRNGTAKQCLDIFFSKCAQLKDHRAGQKRPVYLKIRILRGGSDQNDRAVLHIRKQIILLSLVEPVDLIDEQDRLFPVHSLIVLRLFDHILHILFAGAGRIDLHEIRAGRMGDHLRKRCLSGSRRSVKNDRA